MLITDYVLIAVLVIMSVIAVTITCYDKRAAKAAPKRRTPERTLMLIALLFGSFAMYLTMQLIRHKTKHLKFMIGVPVCMAIDAALIAAYFIFLRPRLG